ncbi:hypothetical protein [Cellulomonas sp. S1-8]|uniref:hypothetical protein n=1 Tax=Cellulomonas sp. S1-8 TaxID=2904790 RepID=UPI002244502C|nr:hypothetical protein [Cellulomonas sp. S1-8]UZN02996.1 hypothetical protein OKX07_18390 [Cellulomonas sp. S1-8]
MPINIAQGAVMAGPSPAHGNALYADASACIHALDYADVWGAVGLIVSIGTTRLDLQGYTATGHANLQIQRNGVPAPSTMSTVLVNPTAQAIVTPGPRRTAQQTEILRNVKSALFRSLDAWEVGAPFIWLVAGAPSS